MIRRNRPSPVVIIGGGFYGAAIGIYLAKHRRIDGVTLLEQEDQLLSRASFNNQARVHNGYHYPRSFTTAFRSRVNFPKFVSDWPLAIRKDFTKLYVVARNNSKVTAHQFERFCREIGAPLTEVSSELGSLFNPRLVEKIFAVTEYAFDATQLALWAKSELNAAGVDVRLSTKASEVVDGPEGLRVLTEGDAFDARLVFNCTYSGIGHLTGSSRTVRARLKHEITEMALVRMPTELQSLGVTVVDGAFFSFMPFPSRGMHTLSHVRYTPHLHWADDVRQEPYLRLSQYDKQTRIDRMVRDAARFVPSLVKLTYESSLFEVKTVLEKNEGDDGRPILFEQHERLPNFYSILGGKIDNVYDVLEKLDEIEFPFA